MRQLLIATSVLILSSIYVLILSRVASSSYTIQKAVVLPAIVFFILAYFYTSSSWKELLVKRSKWLLLFLCTTFVQLIVLSTGGIKSPFLILVHLTMIGISFIFSFATSLIFLLFSTAVIANDLLFYEHFKELLTKDPTTLILQAISLLSIIPLAYIISEHYHFKETLLKKFHTQALTAESILKSLDELIIITDLDLKILSVNDATMKITHKSRSELLNSPIFDVFLLKDKNGKLVNQKILFGDNEKPTKPIRVTDEFTLMKTSIPQQKITLNLQTIADPEGNINQVSFIISRNAQSSPSKQLNQLSDKTKTRLDAIIEDIKKEALSQALPDIYTKTVMVEKFEKDIYYIETLNQSVHADNIARIDIASLCKKIVVANQDFAKTFHVPLGFAIHNFGPEDIAPLVTATNTLQVKPEEITGPFFTAECDAIQIEYAIQKLFDIGILIASNENKPQVILSIDRINQDIVVDISARAPLFTREELDDVFVPYYGRIAHKTGLHSGSGLEGYLAKTAADSLAIRLETNQDTVSSLFSFRLYIPKKQPSQTT